MLVLARTLLLLAILAAAEPLRAVPADVASLLTDVTRASGAAYALHDDRGHSMDCVRVSRLPPPQPPNSSAPLFLAVYHTYDVPTATFNVHAATSSDLLAWSWTSLVAPNADMPSVSADEGGSGAVVLLHEQWVGPDSSSPCRVSARLFPSAWAIARGEPAAAVATKPQTLSQLEGTPSIFAFDALLGEVRFGFHYNDPESGRDQAAGGVLAGLAAGDARWSSWGEVAFNAALTAAGATGNIGGRDFARITAAARCAAGGGGAAAPLGVQLQEGNVGAPPPAPTNWSDWRVFSLDRAAPLAGGFAELTIATRGGSTAFGNPGLALLPPGPRPAAAGRGVAGLDAGILVVSYFLFGEGAAPGEAGSLLFYWLLDCVA
jgi:hypothetical protein